MEISRLEGFGVALEPASVDHARDLAEFAEPELFQYSIVAIPPRYDEAGLAHHVSALWEAKALPYAIISEGRAVGISCYLDVRLGHRAVEIGCTWIGKAVQGTHVNPAAKLLMLENAFERMGCERVQLKCDGRNLHSARAIQKLGAKPEGVLRKHMRLPDGFQRDTHMFSILAGEWPTVREGLLRRLNATI